MSYFIIFGDTYSCGAYGVHPYGGTTQSCAAASPAVNTTSGSLVNTGSAVLLIVALAATIIFAALAVRMWRTSHKRKT